MAEARRRRGPGGEGRGAHQDHHEQQPQPPPARRRPRRRDLLLSSIQAMGSSRGELNGILRLWRHRWRALPEGPAREQAEEQGRALRALASALCGASVRFDQAHAGLDVLGSLTAALVLPEELLGIANELLSCDRCQAAGRVGFALLLESERQAEQVMASCARDGEHVAALPKTTVSLGKWEALPDHVARGVG